MKVKSDYLAASDTWTDTKYDPAKVVNEEATIDIGEISGQGNAQALRMIWNRVVLNNLSDGVDNLDMTNWFGNWVWNWTGIENAQLDQDVRTRRRRGRTFTQRVVVGSTTINEVIGDRTVSLTFIPFIRPRLVYFKAQGLRPATKYFPFFDGVAFDNFVKAETFKDVSNQEYKGNQYQNLNSHPNTSSTLTSGALQK